MTTNTAHRAPTDPYRPYLERARRERSLAVRAAFRALAEAVASLTSARPSDAAARAA